MAALVSAIAIMVVVGGFVVFRDHPLRNAPVAQKGAPRRLGVVPMAPPPRSPAFVFSKAVVWQSDAITDTSSSGFDTRNAGVTAAITKDARDMQTAGVKWTRWWIGPSYSVQLVTAVAMIFRAHGVMMIFDVNAGTDSDAVTEAALEVWLSSLVPAMARAGEHYWEIGNEPNIDYRAGGYWTDCAAGIVPSTTPDQSDIMTAVKSYVVRLRDAYKTIRGADREAFVSSAGLSYDQSYNKFCEIPSAQWIAAFLQTAAWRYMNCFGIHPYADSPDDVVVELAATRQALDGNPRFAHIRFCITEVGFEASKGLSQSKRATDYVTLMNGLKSYGIRTPVFWYNWYDYQSPDGYGLVEYDGLTARTYLPIYSALRRYKP